MANRVVHEFVSLPDAQGAFVFPADKVTRTTGSSVALQTTTRAVIVTTDTDTRAAFDASVGAGDIPLLAVITNPPILVTPNAAKTIYFA
ncbi:hypothetical protein [Caulobacter sp. UC70_42]|uniref:hypothetical protein n=1 Tax=Caulobacter sp. UC70_42 TaxID=3374551 RepID=UPI0037582EA4